MSIGDVGDMDDMDYDYPDADEDCDLDVNLEADNENTSLDFTQDEDCDGWDDIPGGADLNYDVDIDDSVDDML